MEYKEFQRKVILVSCLISTVFMGLFFLSINAEAVIGGSGNVTSSTNPHNFSASSAGVAATDEDRVCIFCHTPHFAITNSTIINAPLWNHKLSSVSTYNVPSSANLANLLSTPANPPDGASKLCLGCHDGSVGVGEVNRTRSFSTYFSMDTTNACILNSQGHLDPVCSINFQNDISSHHPVSIPMNQALIDNQAAACATPGSTMTMVVTYPWMGANPQANTVLLRPTYQQYLSNPGVDATTATGGGASSHYYKDGYYYGVQCSTCHDPHDWTADNTNGYWDANELFLVTDFNTLCNACHDLASCGP